MNMKSNPIIRQNSEEEQFKIEIPEIIELVEDHLVQPEILSLGLLE